MPDDDDRGDAELRAEVERRLNRPFEKVQRQLEELFSTEWDEVEVFISTSADKKARSEADVIVDLVGKAEEKPSVTTTVRRSAIRWIGKPWRERENPWDRFKDRVPRDTPPTTGPDDEWRPWGR